MAEADEPDILGPAEEPKSLPSSASVNILAEISNYTDRPDLLLSEIEKHDPGFIKAMNEQAREFSEQERRERFKFGKYQAYVSLSVQTIAALAILGMGFTLIATNQAGFPTIVAIGVFFAI